MLYHYTDRSSLRSVRREGMIRAKPQRLYTSMTGPFDGSGETLDTPPIVWLSSNPRLDGTIAVKIGLDGIPLVDNMCRILLPDGYAGDLGLAEWSESAGIDLDWWKCVVQTGRMAGSDYTTWRIVPRDIFAVDWVGVEVMKMMGKTEVQWREYR